MQSDVGTEATAAFAFAAFPRRERVFPIEISEDGQRVVRFVVPNPVYRDYPEWKPQPLPATVRRGDFEFTLREFEFVSDGGTHGSHSVTRNGVPVRDWMAHDRVYFDATGNTANTPTLCRCEGAWGLRETFVYSPLPDAESGRGASFPPITVPPPGAKREIDVSATDAGTRLSLVSIAAEREPPREAVPTLPYGMWAERGHVSLLVLCSKDMVLGWRAFRIRDDRGRSLPVGVGRTAPRHLHLTTRVNSDSRTIRIEFTSQPPEEAQVEFLIQPPPPP